MARKSKAGKRKHKRYQSSTDGPVKMTLIHSWPMEYDNDGGKLLKSTRGSSVLVVILTALLMTIGGILTSVRSSDRWVTALFSVAFLVTVIYLEVNRYIKIRKRAFQDSGPFDVDIKDSAGHSYRVIRAGDLTNDGSNDRTDSTNDGSNDNNDDGINGLNVPNASELLSKYSHCTRVELNDTYYPSIGSVIVLTDAPLEWMSAEWKHDVRSLIEETLTHDIKDIDKDVSSMRAHDKNTGQDDADRWKQYRDAELRKRRWRTTRVSNRVRALDDMINRIRERSTALGLDWDDSLDDLADALYDLNREYKRQNVLLNDEDEVKDEDKYEDMKNRVNAALSDGGSDRKDKKAYSAMMRELESIETKIKLLDDNLEIITREWDTARDADDNLNELVSKTSGVVSIMRDLGDD